MTSFDPNSTQNSASDSSATPEVTQIFPAISSSSLPAIPVAGTKISMQERVGTTLGKYPITGVLGQGGMGVVLKGHDELIDRDVAIKLLPSEFSTDELALSRFLTEARAAGKLIHPNVVQIFEVGQSGSDYFLVMEYVSGGSVNDRIQKRGPASVFEATRIISDACRGLGAAHAAGLVHRDVKPANLLRAQDGTTKVTDFGIVKETHADSQQVTRAGVVVGTPYFMSPEQCEGRPVDARSDLYSLGASYYSVLTGANPYAETGSMMQVMFAHCNREPPDPREINDLIPPACSMIVGKAMAKSPDDRYQNAQEMLADLQAVLGALSGVTGQNLWDTQSATNARTLRSKPAAPPTSRRNFLIAGGLTGAAAIGGAGAFWLNSKRRESAPTPAAALPVAPTGEPIKVGVLQSLSGPMATSGSSVVDATLFAIEEINQAGGIQGRLIKPIVVDGRSNAANFAAEAQKLITQQQVCTVFGGWTSSGRKMMKPIFEKHDHLLVYPVQYEGLETSPNIVYLGSAPNQQILPAVLWCRQTLNKKRFFLVGSDYVFPHAAHAIIKDEIGTMGGEIVGEEYVAMDAVSLGPVIAAIQAAQPEMILNCINGAANNAFFRELRSAGITPEAVPTLSFSIGEQELRSMDLDAMTGDYAAWCYFQSLENPENQAFRERFLTRYPQRVINDPMESAYAGVKLWAQAVAEVQDVTPKAIRKAMLTQKMNAPEGPIRIDPDTQHTFKTPRIGQILNDGQFKTVWEAAEPIAPNPFPPSRTAEEWKGFLHDLYTGWGNQWVAPVK